MPKKKTHTLRKQDTIMPSALLYGLRNAAALLDHKRTAEAIVMLEDLDRRYPNRVEVLTELINAAHDTNDLRLYERAGNALLKLTPNMPELTVSVAGVHFKNGHLALTDQAVRDFPTRWPNHPLVEEAKEMLTDLDKILPKYLEGVRLTGPDGIELAALHEKTQIFLESGLYREARQVAKQVLDRHPNYAPTLNNVSQSYYAEGDIDNAIITVRSVLDFEPDNVHALGNLTHYAVITGFPEEAKEFARTLKSSKARAFQKQMKIAEALTYVGDDAGVLAAYKRAEADSPEDGSIHEPLLHHLAGVAAMRQGKQEVARKHWKQALTLEPGHVLASKNLADLSLPFEQRHAPWPFTLPSWVLPPVMQTMQTQFQNTLRSKREDALRDIVRVLLHSHPEIAAVVPILLEKGDMLGRTYALLLAGNSDNPEMRQALRDFAASSHGPDAMRIQAQRIISEFEETKPGTPVRMYIKGEWTEIASMNYEIYSEPMVRHSQHIQDMIEKGMGKLHAGKTQEAEDLFTRALEEEPDDPTILNNLAAVYQVQKRDEDFKEMIRYVYDRHPDYLFGRANMANIYIWEGKLEEARAMLEPLVQQKRLHVSEFSALAGSQIELLLAEGEAKGAEMWLDMWEQVAPDNRNIPILKPRIDLALVASNLASMTEGFKSRRKRKQA